MRAADEGNEFARRRRLVVVEVIVEPSPDPDPRRRAGWMSVRELAASGRVGTVIVKWPAAISPDRLHDLRHYEIQWLKDRGVRVAYFWAPLAAGIGSVK